MSFDIENLSLSELEIVYDRFDKEKNQTGNVYRLSTCYYSTKNGIHLRKDLKLLKRKSKSDFDVLMEESENIGTREAFETIINFEGLPDGIYSLETCNVSRDFETGYIDDYDFKLVPYEE